MPAPVVAEVATSEPVSPAPGAELRTTLDAARGCPRLVQQVLRLSAGSELEGAAGGCAELWYVSSGIGRLATASGDEQLHSGTGLLLRPGPYRVAAGAGSALEVAIVVLPAGTGGVPERELSTRLERCAAEVTGDREFRVLIGPGDGCYAATQFVGDIPPGRAPLHEHTYDEAVLVLAGSGVVHLDGIERPLAPGTCVYLPPGSRHCLENTGTEPMRVLGVFHPGGSPAAKTEHAG